MDKLKNRFCINILNINKLKTTKSKKIGTNPFWGLTNDFLVDF